jgi:hypothetical protein
MESSQAYSRVKMWRFTNVSGTDSVPEMSANLHNLTWLSAWEHSIELCLQNLKDLRCKVAKHDVLQARNSQFWSYNVTSMHSPHNYDQ